jgi:hypothetical protein
MKKLLFSILMLIPLIAGGQDLSGYTQTIRAQEMLAADNNLLRNITATAYGTKGSPNVFEDFTSGTIYFSNKTMVSAKLINYDCHKNEVLHSDGSEVFILNPKDIDFLEFQVQDKSMIFKHVFIKDLKQSLFAEVLYQGRSILYKRHYREFHEADYGDAYSSDRRYDEYRNRHDYYISVENRDPVPLKPRKKDLLKLMQDHSGEIEAYLKAEKIKLKSDGDLVRVVQYWDSLATQSQ